MSEPLAPGDRAALVDYFRSAEKPRERWRVGTEHEKVALHEESLDRVPYEGPRGIGELLERVAAADEGWERILERGNVIALERDGASITLEPGGQLELSGAPLRTARETCQEFNTHVDLLVEVARGLGIVFLGLGEDPFHTVEEVPHMPKARYAIMRSYLPKHGDLGLDMMHNTATVQANFDYADEADMVAKMRVAMGCSPIVSALFANSSLTGGKPNGFITRRVEIWRHTDPARCGQLPFVFEEDFGYERYSEWALDVPLFFVVRGKEYLPVPEGFTFRDFLERGFGEHRASLGDWDTHLTTLFPDARLKRIIEVRGADTVPRDLICALPALWKGILYDPESLGDAWQLVAGWSAETREAALIDVARRGLRAALGGVPALDLARELVRLSAAGLARMLARGETDRDEDGFLDPLREQIELGRSPGEVVLERWEGEWARSPQRLIEYARY